MKVLLVNGSYHEKGCTYTALSEVAKALNANGVAIANQGTRRVWLIPIMNELDYVLQVAQDAIDKIEQES